MKRILIVVIAALAVAGCTKYPPPGGGTDPSDIVTFSTGATTRGTPIDDASQMVDIGTFGYYTGQSVWTPSSLPNRMFDRRLYRDGTEWKYDGAPVEWGGNVIGDHFTFYAYAPFGSAGNGIAVDGDATTGGIPTLTYTVPTDVTQQPDLMVAVPRVDIVKPASGHVSLDMHHALATVGFQVAGNGEQITGLSISGVSMTGTLKMDGGDIEWTELGEVSTATDVSASINFDNGQSYYTATPTMSTDLMKSDGYLMMIPQPLGPNAMLTVTYADATTLEINLDTHLWLPGMRIIYELTIVPDGVIVVEPASVSMGPLESVSRITVDCSDGRDNPAPSLAWTLSTSETWLTLSLDNNRANARQTISGTGSQTVYVFAPINITEADRTAVITLDGTENVVTNVVQHYSMAELFARSNIVMWIDGNGNKILTFAEVEADHTAGKSVTYRDASTSSIVTNTVPAIPANVQGLHFRWGSLVGITSNGTNNTAFSSSQVVFWPTEFASPGTWVFNNSTAIPYAAGSMSNNTDAFEGYPGGTGPGFDKAGAVGDVCRYISDMGWVQGRWRMPTMNELNSLIAETPLYGPNGRVIDSWSDTSFRNITNTGQNNRYGYFRIPDVRVVGKGVSGSDGSDDLRLNPGVAKVVIPGSGYRSAGDGRLYEPGYYAHYWSSSPYGSDRALDLDYNGTQNFYPGNMFSRTNGFSVRCIKE